jgi:hypothetical protein
LLNGNARFLKQSEERKYRMNRDELITLIKHPGNVNPGHIADLKEMVDSYPSFSQARILLAKALQMSNSIHFASHLKLAALYSSDRRGLYYYIYPEEKISTEQYRRENTGKSGDYFEMIEAVTREGEDPRQSLKILADRLRSARTMVVNPVEQLAKKTMVAANPSEIQSGNDAPKEDVKPVPPAVINADASETLAKQLIRERKYKEAIEILRTLNLNNPKKSVYFADQIRFLEKVIVNTKK